MKPLDGVFFVQLKKEKDLWDLILTTHLSDEGVAECNDKDMGITPKFLRDQAFLVCEHTYILTHPHTIEMIFPLVYSHCTLYWSTQ